MSKNQPYSLGISIVRRDHIEDGLEEVIAMIACASRVTLVLQMMG